MRTIAFTFAVLTALLITACGGGKEIEKTDKKDVLVVLRGDKSEILDPYATNSGGDANLIQQMYEGLLKSSAKAPVTWEPCLAESFKHDKNYRVWTFKLRKGVKFHDGATLNAIAVVRSLSRARDLGDPSAPIKLPYAKEYMGDVKTIEATDDMTVVITLSKSNPKFRANLGLFATSIISPTAIKHMESLKTRAERQNWLTSHPAGTGPYTIAEPKHYVDSSTITMTAFENYWGGAPAIKSVVFKYNKDAKNRREQLIAGDAQLVDSPAPADWPLLDKNADVTLYSWDAENLCYLGMNTDPSKGFVTSDVRVRKAIAMAIDRDPMVALYDNTAVPHHVLIPPVMSGFPKGYLPETDRGSREERLKKARALMKEAGIGEVALDLLLPDEARPYLGKPGEVADFIRQQLADIGITIKLVKVTMSDLGDQISKGRKPLVLIGWMGETGEADDFWRPLLSGNGSPSDSNVPRFWNPEVANALDEALVETDPAKRAEMYQALEKTVHDKYRPMVPLLSAQQAVAWRSEVEGLYVDSTGTYRLHKARYK